MGPSLLFRRAVLTVPWLSGPALRWYLRCGGTVPDDYAWLVDGLKRDLRLSWVTRTVTLPDGGTLRIDSRSVVGREIYYCGSYEPGLRHYLRAALRSGATFFDVGANIGELTVMAAWRVGPRGRVYAFEAAPSTFRLLVENVAENRLTNVHTVNAAVGARSGDRTFFLSSGVAAVASSLVPADDFSGQAVTVEGVSLDDFVGRLQVDRVDMVKLDIEGAEFEAVRGGTETLSRYRPVLIVEYHEAVARRCQVDLAAMSRYIEELGYRLHVVDGRGRLRPLTNDVGRRANVVALPDARSAH